MPTTKIFAFGAVNVTSEETFVRVRAIVSPRTYAREANARRELAFREEENLSRFEALVRTPKMVRLVSGQFRLGFPRELSLHEGESQPIRLESPERDESPELLQLMQRLGPVQPRQREKDLAGMTIVDGPVARLSVERGIQRMALQAQFYDPYTAFALQVIHTRRPDDQTEEIGRLTILLLPPAH